MFRGFWDKLEKPVIALSPMDGVTDAAFRFITDTYGDPHILFTEFTPVEAIDHAAVKVLPAFVYHKTDTPTVAQIYGVDLNAYYKSAIVVCELGFDGVDVNMGCPDKNVAKRGAGAGLILQPDHAKEILRTVRRAVEDWAAGEASLETVGLHEDVVSWILQCRATHTIVPQRRLIPVSVKTRIGVEEPVTEWWIGTLLEAEPANISLHGRTLRQMYTGLADWEEIGKAAAVVHGSAVGTTLMGNGDVQSLSEAHERIATYGLDGVLIGRAAFGNPWIFGKDEPSPEVRLRVALEHARAFMRLTPDMHFMALRKHLAWYCKGLPNASDIRLRFVRANTMEEIEAIVEEGIAGL
jgi:tRNA-dihydrouridine synthase